MAWFGRTARLVVSVAMLAALMAPAPLASAQATNTPQNLFAELQKASDSERGKKRLEMVKAAQMATPEVAAQIRDKLIQTVNDRAKSSDKSLVDHCAIALGELKAQEATPALLAALDSPDTPLAYHAAQALGRIWEGKGGQKPQVQDVTQALLASLYGARPGNWSYAPGLALVRIHSIQNVQAMEALSPQELLKEIDKWVAAHADTLPPPIEQSWQLLLRRIVVAQDPGLRDNLIQTMLQKRELGPVFSILRMQTDQNVPEETRRALADALGQLSGLPFPPQGQEKQDIKAAARLWQESWLDKLKQVNDHKYIDYTLSQMDRALRAYRDEPSENTSELIKGLYLALLHQLPGPQAIPPTASEQASKMLKPPLALKEKIANTIHVLQDEGASGFDKAESLKAVEEVMKEEHADEVGALFLDQFARIAAHEQNTMLTVRLGNILLSISKVPVKLGGETLEERQKALKDWVAIVKKEKDITIDLGL
ncbi:MAG: hypothetical protein J7M08_01530 [Planctomycetes bacterium]|nr:hypothetical protein [Planctomycetota bacterium]